MKMTPFITILLLTLSCAVNARIPVPGNIIYGVVGIAGEPLGAADTNVTINVSVNGKVLASYTMGENASIADRYILRVPMDILAPADPDAAREGDTAVVSTLVNGVESFQTPVTIGASSTVIVLNLGGVGDHDADGIPDGSDPDRDNDGINNVDDLCPTGATAWTSNSTTDNDADGCRDSDEDLDDDNDGFSDIDERAAGTDPLNSADHPITDGDSDSDGVADDIDNCPSVSNSEQFDFDDDALGDDCDPDDDNDGYDDELELALGSDPFDADSIPPSGINIIVIKAALDAQAKQ